MESRLMLSPVQPPGKYCTAESANFIRSRLSPLIVKTGEPRSTAEELLHGGLFEVALLGDKPVQPAQQLIHVTRTRDRALFR